WPTPCCASTCAASRTWVRRCCWSSSERGLSWRWPAGRRSSCPAPPGSKAARANSPSAQISRNCFLEPAGCHRPAPQWGKRMRLLMFDDGSGRRLGALRDTATEQVVDLAALAGATGAPAPPIDLLSLIDRGDAG